MPVKIKNIGKGKVSVTTPGGVKSKSTTMANAKKQQRLLNAIEHNPNFKPSKNYKKGK